MEKESQPLNEGLRTVARSERRSPGNLGVFASDNPSAADELEEHIYAACELLSKNPRAGHKRPDLTAVFGPCTVELAVVLLELGTVANCTGSIHLPPIT
jgi:plasmid stabilization system protein ParE